MKTTISILAAVVLFIGSFMIIKTPANAAVKNICTGTNLPKTTADKRENTRIFFEAQKIYTNNKNDAELAPILLETLRTNSSRGCSNQEMAQLLAELNQIVKETQDRRIAEEILKKEREEEEKRLEEARIAREKAIEEETRKLAEEVAKKEAEEKAKLEAEAEAKRLAEEQAALEKSKKEAEEKAKLEEKLKISEEIKPIAEKEMKDKLQTEIKLVLDQEKALEDTRGKEALRLSREESSKLKSSESQKSTILVPNTGVKTQNPIIALTGLFSILSTATFAFIRKK